MADNASKRIEEFPPEYRDMLVAATEMVGRTGATSRGHGRVAPDRLGGSTLRGIGGRHAPLGAEAGSPRRRNLPRVRDDLVQPHRRGRGVLRQLRGLDERTPSGDEA